MGTAASSYQKKLEQRLEDELKEKETLLYYLSKERKEYDRKYLEKMIKQSMKRIDSLKDAIHGPEAFTKIMLKLNISSRVGSDEELQLLVEEINNIINSETYSNHTNNKLENFKKLLIRKAKDRKLSIIEEERYILLNNRPCGKLEKKLHPTAYKRKELVDMAREYGIKDANNLSKIDLCLLLEKYIQE